MAADGWDGIQAITTTSRWEQHWRAGYTIGDATPVSVTEYHHSERDARKAAVEAATVAVAKLREAGANLTVVPWIELWRSRTHTETMTAPATELEPYRSSVRVVDGYVRPDRVGIPVEVAE